MAPYQHAHLNWIMISINAEWLSQKYLHGIIFLPLMKLCRCLVQQKETFLTSVHAILQSCCHLTALLGARISKSSQFQILLPSLLANMGIVQVQLLTHPCPSQGFILLIHSHHFLINSYLTANKILIHAPDIKIHQNANIFAMTILSLSIFYASQQRNGSLTVICLIDTHSIFTLLAPNCTLAFPLTKVALICMMTDSIE